MRLSKEYQYIVLCEDAQMKSFITGFLKIHGIGERSVRVRNYPAGKGCGEAFVKKEYDKEVRYLQSKSYNRLTLVVCSDADKYTCDERIGFIEEETRKRIGRNRDKEKIIMWIPKREIETWICFLNGEDVDEEQDFRHSGKPQKCRKQAQKMAEYCQDQIELDTRSVPSLMMAKKEYCRVCELQA